MLLEIQKQLFARDLAKLVEEIEHYPTNESLWVVTDGISNSSGNLVLHLCGNLNHFIGAQLGETGYVRQRDREFSDTGLSKEDLIGKVKFTANMVAESLDKLDEKDLAKTYPIEVMGKEWPTGFFLSHLVTHLSYHLGQINYHRRLLAQFGNEIV